MQVPYRTLQATHIVIDHGCDPGALACLTRRTLGQVEAGPQLVDAAGLSWAPDLTEGFRCPRPGRLDAEVEDTRHVVPVGPLSSGGATRGIGFLTTTAARAPDGTFLPSAGAITPRTRVDAQRPMISGEHQRRDVWAVGAAYEPYVGRWSRLVARELLVDPGAARS